MSQIYSNYAAACKCSHEVALTSSLFKPEPNRHVVGFFLVFHTWAYVVFWQNNIEQLWLQYCYAIMISLVHFANCMYEVNCRCDGSRPQSVCSVVAIQADP